MAVSVARKPLNPRRPYTNRRATCRRVPNAGHTGMNHHAWCQSAHNHTASQCGYSAIRFTNPARRGLATT